MEGTTKRLDTELTREWEVLNRYGTIAQGYKLEQTYLTYDENSDIIVVTKNNLEQLGKILNFVDFENKDAIGVAVKRLAKGQGMSSDIAHNILSTLIDCSLGRHKFINIASGSKVPEKWLNELGLLSGRFLGCSVIGIAKDNSLKILRKSSESIGDMSRIDDERFKALYNTIALCYGKVLGVPGLTSFVGILITTLCAEAKVKGKLKFISHNNYFESVDKNMDWIYDLEGEFGQVNTLDESSRALMKYINAILYTEKELESTILKRKGDKEAVFLVDRIDKLESKVQMSNEVIAMLKKGYLPKKFRYYTLEELHTTLTEEQSPKGMDVF